MVCPNFQFNNPADAKFCNNCGPRLEAGTQLAPAVAGLMPPEFAERLQAARASHAMVGERRIVTMLFCDVKGSTAAAERLDPEEWTDIMNGAFEPMIRPVYKYGICSPLFE